MKIVVAILALSLSGCMQQHQKTFTLGHSSFTLPPDWREVSGSAEKLVLASADARQQLTISLMHVSAAVTFEDFRLLCEKRFEAERRELVDGFIKPDAPDPFKNSDGFGMFFSGGEKGSGRVFSGYLLLRDSELVSVYLEGLGLAPKDHLESFKIIVGSISRN